ncbi:MAG: class I SAM-dependent methyltransferase [Clostridia bacterium]|nr:class I SAM-dependent methyltransferase [Clostridia bacterium]MBQ4086017.1 class I SAM-dependent methyltransferase [Clostridia bacterium]
MPDQYFTAAPASESRPREIEIAFGGHTFPFTTDSGVFSKDDLDTGSRLLIENLPHLGAGQRGLDLGCGWGPVGTIWAKGCPEAEFQLTDINERAAALAAKNLQRNGIGNAKAVSGDALESVDGLFDAIALNPPIRTGKENIYRMFRESMARLTDSGALYIVIRVKQGADSAKKMLKNEFGNCETLDRGSGFHVLMCKKEAEQ